jgi:hypothetical protein
MDVSPPVGRVYRMSWLFRIFTMFFLVFGCTAAVAFVRDGLMDPESLTWVKLLIAIVFPVVGMFMTAKAFSSTLVFSADSVTMRSLLDTRSVEYSHIRGRREYVLQGKDGSTRYLRLDTTDGSKPFDFGKRLYVFDDAFWAWFNALPDLDAMDKVTHKGSNFGLV